MTISRDGGRSLRLPTAIVDNYAAEEPDRPYALIPKSSDLEDGYKGVTYKALANAINYFAWKISALVKPNTSNEEFPTVAYIGPNDVRYPIIILACIKARCKAFLFSPRNSFTANLSLFNATKPAVLIYADRFAALAPEWLKAYPMKSLQIPSLEDCLMAEPTEPYPYAAVFEEAQWHPSVVLHTSGSTGIPKPVVQKLGSLGVLDMWLDQPKFNGAEFILNHWAAVSQRPLLALPTFHAGGLANYIIQALYCGQTVVFMPADKPLISDVVIKSLIASKADSLLTAASLLEDMAKSEEAIQALARLQLTGFGGGAMAPVIGDMLVRRGVKLQTILSTTEAMPYHMYHQKDYALWNWHIINEASMGAEFREEQSSSNSTSTFELVIKRLNKDPGLQTVFYTFPEKDEWPTGDRFEKHPTIPGHWLYIGRVDDIIVFSNGEKLNPTQIEATVVGHHSVSRALVVGSRRFQPALIIEPNVTALRPFPSTKEEQDAFISELWPVIEEANKVSPQHGKIVRRLVALMDPTMPFPLSSKATIQRRAAVELYENFIDNLYDRAEREPEDVREAVLDFQSVESLTESIVHLLEARLDVVQVTPETDLFSIGFDSLQVISLSHMLQSAMNAAGFPITKDLVAPSVIYAHFTPQNLAEYLFFFVKEGGRSHFSMDHFDANQIRTLGEFIRKYTADLPAPNPDQADPLDNGQTVLVTGTTGSLGAYMLSRLIDNPRIEKIVALNRGSDGGASRQPARNAAHHLSMDLSKVEFHGVDLSLPMWGLSKDVYDGLLTSADRIIHGAWPAHFMVSIETLEPFVRGVRHLVDFSNKADKRVPIIFVSSVSAVDNWPENSPVPEHRLEDPTLPIMGYGRSKAAASAILDAASDVAGVPTVSIRTGLIVGPRGEEGLWNKHEFMPSLVASSAYLEVLPDSIGPSDVIDWLPIEDVADIVLDLAGITEPRPVSDISGYFHCVNPNTAHWSSMALAIKDFYGDRIQKIVSLAEWVDALEKSANDETTDATKNPGIKLLPTYQSMLAAQRAGTKKSGFALERTKRYSKTMRDLKTAVDGDLMKRWCKQWQY